MISRALIHPLFGPLSVASAFAIGAAWSAGRYDLVLYFAVSFLATSALLHIYVATLDGERRL